MPKVKGPKDGQIVTASFDGKSKSLFPSLKTTKDLVLLSIRGNEYCAGEFLEAIVQQAVATHQSKSEDVGAQGKATFLVADEIYWHNLKGTTNSLDEVANFKLQALQIGDDYITSQLKYFLAPLGLTEETFNETYPRNTVDQKIEIINRLASEQGKNFEIMRWKKWVSQNSSQSQIDKMIPYYESIPGLKVAIDQSVAEFVKRHSKSEEEQSLWGHRSRGYVTEESPGIMWQAASLGYNFIIYPGEILPSLKATKEFFVAKNHVPYISEGESIQDTCPHNEHCIHVENPSRLINWLEVNFQRSRSNNLKVSTKESGFFSTVKPKSDSTPRAEVTITPPIADLEVSAKPQLEADPPGSDVMEMMVVKKKGRDNRSEMRSEREVMLASIVEGVTNALASEFRSQNENGGAQSIVTKRKAITSSSPLAEVFEGITRGVLDARISNSDKLDFLLEFTDNFLNQKIYSNAMTCS